MGIGFQLSKAFDSSLSQLKPRSFFCIQVLWTPWHAPPLWCPPNGYASTLWGPSYGHAPASLWRSTAYGIPYAATRYEPVILVKKSVLTNLPPFLDRHASSWPHDAPRRWSSPGLWRATSRRGPAVPNSIGINRGAAWGRVGFACGWHFGGGDPLWAGGNGWGRGLGQRAAIY